MARRLLILGASYGSLLATKLLMAGHHVTLVCTAPTAQLLEHEGTRVLFPGPGGGEPLEVRSRTLPGLLGAHTPDAVDPAGFDLVVLAMQEAQYAARDVAALMRRIAAAQRPCLALMNMPPLAYLRRLPGVRADAVRDCYVNAELWDAFDPALMTMASPDAQAFRPPGAAKNVLQVGLPTNFKVARFATEAPTGLLRELAHGIEAARLAAPEPIAVPVKLKVHDSPFVPLAKWPMLVTGNYRCITRAGAIAIRDAVHGDRAASAALYQWATEVCLALGAAADDLVAFDRYARAAESLLKPSSVARALGNGALHVERVDRLIERLAQTLGRHDATVSALVREVDARLAANRAAAVPPPEAAALPLMPSLA